LPHAIAFELRETRQRRRPWRSSLVAFGVAEVGEDQAEVLLAGKAPDRHLLGEAGVLGGLLDALAGGIVLPAVVEAANAVPFHPAGAELRPPVRAAEVQEMWAAVLATIQREVLVDDADRLGVARLQILRPVHRLPEA